MTQVIDGDTVDVLCDGISDRVRLLRIDTPERGEPDYYEATRALERMVQGRDVDLVFERPGTLERGSYGRVLAYLYADKRNVNVEMVRQGWSGFWTKYGEGRFAEEFRAAEADATGVAAPADRRPLRLLEAETSGETTPDCVPRSQCCRVCARGKACGNSCIGRRYTCRKGRGCACDSYEICG